jgi:hypothetical protein
MEEGLMTQRSELPSTNLNPGLQDWTLFSINSYYLQDLVPYVPLFKTKSLKPGMVPVVLVLGRLKQENHLSPGGKDQRPLHMKIPISQILFNDLRFLEWHFPKCNYVLFF